MNILVTGGFGFIGSAFIRALIDKKHFKICNVDFLTYAANSKLGPEFDRYGVRSVNMDIRSEDVKGVIDTFKPDWIVNFAAETHVDNSICAPEQFINTNILGTYNLLFHARNYFERCNTSKKNTFRFLHVSTDEIYGSLRKNQDASTEVSTLKPSSPYSASKASADCLVIAWNVTYGLPGIITNCSNNYGPFQFKEKLIPKTILNAINGNQIPVYGNGSQQRDWIFVDDHVEGILAVLKNGLVGERYNIGAEDEKPNLEVIASILEQIHTQTGKPLEELENLVTFVTDRPGHDQRYALDITKIKNHCGWQPKTNFEVGIKATVDWYIKSLETK